MSVRVPRHCRVAACLTAGGEEWRLEEVALQPHPNPNPNPNPNSNPNPNPNPSPNPNPNPHPGRAAAECG